MKDFRAIFRRGRDGEALLEMSLCASTIQAAIDEAKAIDAADRLGADRLDIVADGSLVETVGLGVDPYRT